MGSGGKLKKSERTILAIIILCRYRMPAIRRRVSVRRISLKKKNKKSNEKYKTRLSLVNQGLNIRHEHGKYYYD